MTGHVDDAVDCPVEVPVWLMGLCGFLGDLPCWTERRTSRPEGRGGAGLAQKGVAVLQHFE